MKPIDPPLLIAKPCPASWTDMKGDDKRRFCEQCNLHVHNLSAMNDRERTEFVEKNGTTECIAYIPLPDGRIEVPTAWDRVGEFFRPLYRHARAALLLLFPFLGSAFAADPAPPPVPGSPSVPPPKQRNGHVAPGGAVILGDPVEPPTLGKPVNPRVVMGKVAPQKKTDYEVVKDADRFSIGGIGVAGTVAPAEEALRRIVQAKDVATLQQLAVDAEPAGQLYAVLGLKLLKNEGVEKAAKPLLKSRAKVSTAEGCSLGSTQVSTIATDIMAGKYR